MVLAAVATLLGAYVQSATGFGFALILSPVMFAALDPAPALTTLLCLAAGLNLLVLFSEGREHRIRRRELAVILVAATPGLLIGTLILRSLSKPALQILIGTVIVIAVLMQIRAVRLQRSTPEDSRPPGPLAALAGFLAGTFTTTTGTNGPPMMLWLQRAGASPSEVRDTLAAAFLILNVAGTVVLVVAVGEDYQFKPAVIVPLLALVLAGQLAGRFAFERLDRVRFRQVGLALVLAAGIASIAAGAVGVAEPPRMPLSDLVP